MPPDVSKVRVWGCTVWYFLPEHERDSKISPRAVPAVHLGCDEKRNGHLVYKPYLNRITTGYHLAFHERKFLKFTAEGIVNIPRNVRPLNTEGVEREKRDHTTHEGENTTHEDVEVSDKEALSSLPGAVTLIATYLGIAPTSLTHLRDSQVETKGAMRHASHPSMLT